MHKLTENFDGQKKKYEDFRAKIEVLIKELLVQKEINFHKIESRVKSISKIEEKINRKNDKYSSIDEITDIVGFRIITYFENEVDEIAKIIDKEFIKDIYNSIDKRNLDSDRFGYRSLHYVVTINNERRALTEYQRFKDIKCEIQIRSVLQHAWAEIEHDIGYKGEHSIPNSLKRNFYRVAALLETADIEFVKIKEQLKLYESKIGDEIKDNPGEVEINTASLNSYIQSSKIVSELDQIISANSKHKLDKLFRFDSIIENLYFVDIKTIEQLDKSLNDYRKLIIAFADAYLGQTGRGNIPVGICLFYLCYVLVGLRNDFDFAKKYSFKHITPEDDDAIVTAKELMKTFQKISKK